MGALPGGHAIFVGVALATHALVGVTVGAVLIDRPLAGGLGGVVADFDLLFPGVLGWPLVHRGLTHSLLVALVATGVVFALHRRAGIAFGAGYATQLAIDLTTPQGVPLLYPFGPASIQVQLPIAGHSAEATVLMWTLCIGALYASDSVAPGRIIDRETE